MKANGAYRLLKKVAGINQQKRKVKSGGFILGDGYGIKGWFYNGVTKAVDGFVSGHELEMRVDFTHTQSVCSGYNSPL